MTLIDSEIGNRVYWFAGATFSKSEDQVQRFITEGIWEVRNPTEKEKMFVKSMKPGDLIAIKAAYVRKKNLPFDNRGNAVSVMSIKATGNVIENPGDGEKVRVAWTPVEPQREWYFYTFRATLWRVTPESWEAEALIRFAFEGKDQDIDRFRNEPYWRERFGDKKDDKDRFKWTRFYEELADKLLEFKDKRHALLDGIYEISSRINGLSYLSDKFMDGTTGRLKDICPFTTLGIINRGITVANRKIIAKEMATFLGVSEEVPESFEGVPLLNNQKSWFFGNSQNDKKKSDDIDALWEMFEKAITFSGSEDFEARDEFAASYDNVSERYNVGWNLTMGLFWIRPWVYPSLDNQSRQYIRKKLNIQIGQNGPKGRCSAADYLALISTFENSFAEDTYPVHSFPGLSLAALQFQPVSADGGGTWLDVLKQKIGQMCSENKSQEFTRKQFQDRFLTELELLFPDNKTISSTIDRVFQILRDDEQLEFISPGSYRWLGADPLPEPPIIESYSVENIMNAGCFFEPKKIETMLERLRVKKNLILQGPPGTGKTWLAKKLAFALMGERDENRVRAVQFHPNLTYEDFVRGWRPDGDGKLSLMDGPFIEMIEAALKNATSRYVIVIEEINRGNPAQIFGEMLTLLEADKRTPSEALELSYRRFDNERVFIPSNLYVIGTMNIADRSLALVDLALRRRFAFIDLEPTLGLRWQKWLHTQCGIDIEILVEIEKRILDLNKVISADTGLGPQFCIGHSYVTPARKIPVPDAKEWFRQVVDTEIGPLLDEYWYDALEKTRNAKKQLLEGF